MTLFTEIEDLKTVMKTISALDYVDKSRIYLMGSSLGGVVSALVAEEMPASVSGLILFYPAFNISSLVNGFSGFPGMETAFTQSLKDYDIMEHIGNYPGPVLIIQGTKDFISKFEIALKECNESEYWLELLFDVNSLSKQDFDRLQKDCIELRRMLVSTVTTLKSK